jgi:hypothetical protein
MRGPIRMCAVLNVLAAEPTLSSDLDNRTVETVTVLLDHGVDLSVKEFEGMNAVSYEAWHKAWVRCG